MHNSPRARAVALALAAALSATVASHTVAAPSIPDGLPTGCRDTCSTPFSPPQRSVVRLSGGCVARITWIARPSCGVGWDLVVLRVEPLTDGCGGIAIERLVNEATDSLIAGRETGFFTMAAPRDTCIVVGRILRAACWGVRVECGDTIVAPCDSTSCCESPVVLCTDEIFRRRIVRGPSTLRAPCDPRRACTPVCGVRRDSTWEDDPVDTLAPDEHDIGSFSARPTPLPDGATGATGALSEPPRSWPWRDPRPVRAAVRAVREAAWRLAERATRARRGG